MARSRLLMRWGDDLDRTVIWEQDDSPVDLSDYIVTCNITVGEVVIDLTEGDGITMDDEAGSIAVHLTAAETDLFEEQFGTWQLYVMSAYDAQTLAEGLVFVSFGG